MPSKGSQIIKLEKFLRTCNRPWLDFSTRNQSNYSPEKANIREVEIVIATAEGYKVERSQDSRTANDSSIEVRLVRQLGVVKAEVYEKDLHRRV